MESTASLPRNQAAVSEICSDTIFHLLHFSLKKKSFASCERVNQSHRLMYGDNKKIVESNMFTAAVLSLPPVPCGSSVRSEITEQKFVELSGTAVWGSRASLIESPCRRIATIDTQSNVFPVQGGSCRYGRRSN
jgi:hypothetical protein